MEELRFILSFLLFSQTYSHFFPSKRGLLTSIMWKIAPSEKISHSGSMCCPLERVVTSGATYPGVPHLQNMQSSESASAANPKSTITGLSPVYPRSIMFSGFISRCIILYSCIYFNPVTMPFMNSFISEGVNTPSLWLIRLWSWPFDKSSKTMQMEFQDSNTPSHLMMFGESKVLSI